MRLLFGYRARVRNVFGWLGRLVDRYTWVVNLVGGLLLFRLMFAARDTFGPVWGVPIFCAITLALFGLFFASLYLVDRIRYRRVSARILSARELPASRR